MVSITGQNYEDCKLNTHTFLSSEVLQWLRFFPVHGQVLSSSGIPNGYLASLALNEVASCYPGWDASSAGTHCLVSGSSGTPSFLPPGPCHRHTLPPEHLFLPLHLGNTFLFFSSYLLHNFFTEAPPHPNLTSSLWHFLHLSCYRCCMINTYLLLLETS